MHRISKEDRVSIQTFDHMKQSVASSTGKSVFAFRPSKPLIWLGSQGAVRHIQKMSERRIWRKILKFRRLRGDFSRYSGYAETLADTRGRVTTELFDAFDAVLCNYSDVLEKKESERYKAEMKDLMEKEREDPRHGMVGYNFNEKEDFTFDELEALELANLLISLKIKHKL